jgi:CD109 antigen
LKPGSYQLEVQTLERNAATFSTRHFLFLESKTFSIFIQTEKAIYRRGELVRYRVLVLDADTRPIKVDQNLTMSIYDAGQTLVLLRANQNALHGVHRGSFRVGSEDKLGVWTIEADFQGKQIRKSIEVADYVAPRFQVAMSVPTKIGTKTSQFLVSVDAKYTFGRPVRGIVTISLTPVFFSPGAWPEMGEPLIGSDAINGRYLFPFEMNKFGDSESTVFNAIMVQASVEERTTGVIIKSHDKTILIDPSKQATKYKITVTSLKFYLPGAEYLLSVQVTASNGRDIPEDNRTIDLRVSFNSEELENSTVMSFQLDGKGRGDRLIEVPATAREGMNIRCDYLDAFEEVRIDSKRLHVQVITETPVLNKKVEFRVGSLAPLSSLSYYIVGRGNLLVSKTVPVADKQFETFAFDATFAMTPVCSLVVFHVDKEGDIISDYTEITFSQDSLQNSVSPDGVLCQARTT